MTEGEVANARRSQRRRSRRSNRQSHGWKSPLVGKGLFWSGLGMLALGATYMAYGLHLGANMAGLLLIGLNKQEVTYIRGNPAGQGDGGQTWFYTEGAGAQGVVRFGPDGRTRTISCMQRGQVALGCSSVLGVGMGDGEDRLRNRLGSPTQERYVKGGKLMVYADMGLVFTMQEFRVTGITKYAAGGLGYLVRVPWAMLP
jgi:hypothetical protein